MASGIRSDYMTVEQIAIRQEIRQMLNEAGINKNTLQAMVKQVLSEEMNKACDREFKGRDIERIVSDKVDKSIRDYIEAVVRSEIRDRISSTFRYMTVSVDITDKNGTSSITK